MSGFAGIAAVGQSIERLLALAFAQREPVPGYNTRAVLVNTEDLTAAKVKTTIGAYALSIFLYRVDFNKAMRASWSAVGSVDGRGHLALDLHYLLTPWSDNAVHDQMILGRAMQAIEYAPVLSGPLLYSLTPYPDEPRASAGEEVQLLLEEISTEALMRTFDSLPIDYRLTVPYIARVVRIDTLAARPAPPVIDEQIRVLVPT
jgi:hypothetical protein